MNIQLRLFAMQVVALIHAAPTQEIKDALKVIHDAAATESADFAKIKAAYAAVAGDPFGPDVAKNAAKALFPAAIPEVHATAPPIPPPPAPPTPAPVETPAETPA